MKKIFMMEALAMCITLHSDAQKKNNPDSVSRVKVISGNIVVSPNSDDAARFNKAMRNAGKNAAKVVNGALNMMGSCSSQNASTSTYVNPSTPYSIPNNANKKATGKAKKSSKK